ncbi:hypothetical protein, partial [Bradyrhizobium sp. P5_C11_2]
DHSLSFFGIKSIEIRQFCLSKSGKLIFLASPVIDWKLCSAVSPFENLAPPLAESQVPTALNRRCACLVTTTWTP